MATIANWNGHTFEVASNLIRGFTDFSIRGSCETTTKNTDNQKYEEHKYGESPEISMTIALNALTGVTDVFGEAMEFVNEATQGACAYFYMGTRKLVPAQLMLISAEVTQVVIAPGNGSRWISCDVNIEFKQGTKNDSSTSNAIGASGGTITKASVKVKSPTTTTSALDTAKTIVSGLTAAVAPAVNALKTIYARAKSGSQDKTEGGLGTANAIIKGNTAATTSTSTSNTKVLATTGRTVSTVQKITVSSR